MLATKRARLHEIVRALSTLVRPRDDLSRRLRIFDDREGTRFAVYGRECGGSILARDLFLEELVDVAVELPLLERILSASDSEHVRLDIEKSNLKISLDRAVLSIPLLDTSYASPFMMPQIDLRFRTNLAALRTGLRNLDYVIESRPMPSSTLRGNYVVFDLDSATSDSVLLAGIENRRLSIFRLPVQFQKENSGGRFLVFPDTFELLFRTFRTEKDEEVTISISENVVLFKVRDCEAFSAGVNASIPDFLKVVDRFASRSKFEANVSAQRMRNALRQIEPVVDPESRRVELVFARDEISVLSSGSLRGEVVIDATCTVTEVQRIFVDHRLISDYFEACGSVGVDEIRILFGGPRDALLFVSGNFPPREPNDALHILMPMMTDR